MTLTRQGQNTSLTLSPAEQGPPLATGRLASAVVLHGRDGDLEPAALAALVYLAIQRARVWRRSAVITTDPRIAQVLLHTSEPPRGEGPWLEAIDRAAHNLYSICEPEGRTLLAGRFVDEATACLLRHARAFAANAWCRAAQENRLTRQQYITALGNTHQYVRLTPRLLARAIAVSENEELRDHFTRHFRGEQKHDRFLESDLRYLGADLNFVLHEMTPSLATQAFMTAQESMIAFYQDPILFLAVPFVAEGIVSHVDPQIFEYLAANIRRWGFDEPARAMRFYITHVREDGGEDGHWARTIAVLARYLDHDTIQRRFLAVLNLAADAFIRSYDNYADDFDLCI